MATIFFTAATNRAGGRRVEGPEPPAGVSQGTDSYGSKSSSSSSRNSGRWDAAAARRAQRTFSSTPVVDGGEANLGQAMWHLAGLGVGVVRMSLRRASLFFRDLGIGLLI